MKKLKKETPEKDITHFKVVGFVLVLFLVCLYFWGQSSENKEARVQKKLHEISQQEDTKPAFQGGYYRYNIKRIKLTASPQRYTFNKSADWEGWYDDSKTALPFIVQFSPDGEKLDCKNPAVNHPPLGEIWVSKYPGNPDHYVNFSFSYSKNTQKNLLKR